MIFFKLNSRIPLVRSSSELVVHCARERYLKYSSSTPPKYRPEGPRISPHSSLAVKTLVQRPLGPTLRANPFPKVTYIFSRLPLSTFIYRLEAANPEDLMRLLVRLGVQINQSSWFSRDVQGAPKQPRAGRLSRGSTPISGQPDSRDSALVKKKIELSLGIHPPSPPLLVFPLNIHILDW